MSYKSRDKYQIKTRPADPAPIRPFHCASCDHPTGPLFGPGCICVVTSGPYLKQMEAAYAELSDLKLKKARAECIHPVDMMTVVVDPGSTRTDVLCKKCGKVWKDE